MNNYLQSILSGQTIRSFLRVLDDYWQIITDTCVINVFTEMYVLDEPSRIKTVFDSSSMLLFENTMIREVIELDETKPITIIFDGAKSIKIQPIQEDDSILERMTLFFNDGRIVVIY